MTERTTLTNAVFRCPAVIDGLDLPLPAGTYAIETIEQQIAGLSFVAFSHVQTTIEVPANTQAFSGRQRIAIEPKALKKALDEDRLRAEKAPPPQDQEVIR